MSHPMHLRNLLLFSHPTLRCAFSCNRRHCTLMQSHSRDNPECISRWGPNTFALHTSTDFISWRHHTDDILADGSGRPGMYCLPGTPGCTPTGACGAFLPKVIFNRKTGLFVLWWTCATCSVATSSSPSGPWTVSSYNVTYSDGKPVCHGSINFFVDEATAEGYLVKNW